MIIFKTINKKFIQNNINYFNFYNLKIKKCFLFFFKIILIVYFILYIILQNIYKQVNKDKIIKISNKNIKKQKIQNYIVFKYKKYIIIHMKKVIKYFGVGFKDCKMPQV